MGNNDFMDGDVMYSDEQRERIRDALYEMFLKNKVAIVDNYEGELKAFQIRVYVLRKAGIN